MESRGWLEWLIPGADWELPTGPEAPNMDEIPHEMKQKQTSRTIAPLQSSVLLEASQREDSPDDIPSSLVGSITPYVLQIR